jgi:phosphoribosylanthranilate isomerase
MTRIKVCGLTRAEDVALCAGLGADYVGFNFSARSPRRVDAGGAAGLLAASNGCRRVGVFVDESADAVRAAIDSMRLDLLQFHRPLEDGDFAYGLPLIAVERVFGAIPAVREELARCHAVLYDAGHPTLEGGTGETFAWDRIPCGGRTVPIGVAGGLRAENVGDAIRAARPFFVDVASGVEAAPGVKDASKVRAFFAAVRKADG